MQTGNPHLGWRCAAALYFVASVYALLQPGSGEPPPFAHFDKLGHALLFAVQAALMQRGWPRLAPVPAFVLLLAWALASEGLQAWLTTTRQGDWLDATADMLGAGLALWLGWAARRRSSKLLALSAAAGRP